MNVGTKSLLFGVHQFIWHPITVYRAWCWIYKSRPSWRQVVCIIVHDWGYWGCKTMDGKDGELHPLYGANVAYRLLDDPGFYQWRTFCLGHSRTMSKILGIEVSDLCAADKLSMKFDPCWFYMLRAHASGEIIEYRRNSDSRGFMPAAAPDRCWYNKMVTYENAHASLIRAQRASRRRREEEARA